MSKETILAFRELADALDAVMRLDTPEIRVAEQKIAFYTAMIKTAKETPDNPEGAEEVIRFMEETLKAHVAEYMLLTNDYL